VGKKVTRFSRVLIAEDKLIAYLLNLAHEKGGPKARFFISTCGFSPDNPRALEAALQNHPRTAQLKEVRETDYGWNYTFVCNIQSPDRGPICIVSVWRIGWEEGIPSLVSARPLRKRERQGSR